MNWLKELLKPFPQVYYALVYLFGAQEHFTSALTFARSFAPGSRVLNVGSGPRRLRDDIVNIDIIKFEGVDVVAPADKLPFDDASADGIVCDNVLEHVRDPKPAIKEMWRVLKPGGLIYVAVPFVMTYHSSPDDFNRFTLEGMRECMKDFEEVELNVQHGPTTTLMFVLCEWLALVLSFGSKTLYSAVLVLATLVTAPLKFLDYIFVHYRGAENLANSFYFIGKKK